MHTAYMRPLPVLAAALIALLGCTSAGEPSPASSAARSTAAGSTRTAAVTYADWYAYHGNTTRSGAAGTMPRASGAPRVIKRLAVDGQVYASPLVIGGKTIVATENNTVYAFSPSFTLLWKRHLGPPSPASQRPCGNISPLGITGTPAYAAATGLIYAAPEFSGNPPTHQLVGISLKTGAVAFRRSLDFAGADRRVMQERGAILVNHHGVYTAFGGLAGDCGAYKGRVIRYALNGRGSASVFTVPTSREAGIWTPPGPVYDGRNVFVAVGNGESSRAGDRYDYSDSILKLDPTSLRRVDSFSPKTWRTDNASDLDLGSQGPAIVGSWVFSAGKSGAAYVLRRSHLGGIGGIGGEVSSQTLCRSFGGTAVVGSVVYVPCTDGVRAVRIDSAGRMHVVWRAGANIAGSPVVGGGRVWALDTGAGRLYALNPTTGATVNSVSVGSVSRFATPAIYGRDLQIPTLSGVTVVRTS
jgi:outer membrane protein assembly factor BamB